MSQIRVSTGLSIDTTGITAMTGRGYSSGQVMVITALVIAVLLGAMALGTDVAVLYYNWVQLQKAADSGVLAGANYLTGDSSTNTAQVVSVTNNYAEANGVQASEIVSTTVASDYKSVSIQLSRIVPYFFARLVGLTTGNVAATATAGINATSQPMGILPIGLDCPTAQASSPNCGFQTYSATSPTSPIQLKLPPSGSVGAGNWEPLALGGNGGATYKNNITYGYQSPMSLDGWVNAATEPGQLVGPTVQGFQNRMPPGVTSYS